MIQKGSRYPKKEKDRVIGMLENQREHSEVERMSLEHAYSQWKEGKLRTVLALHAARVCECECGNAAGTECFTSEHVAMRQTMQSGLIPDGETVHVGIISQG